MSDPQLQQAPLLLFVVHKKLKINNHIIIALRCPQLAKLQ